MRIISCNLNGVRSASRKNFWPWLLRQNADIVCLQEIRASEEDLPEEVKKLEGYHTHFRYASKKGYSGVGLFSRIPPRKLNSEFGHPELENEGRFLMAEFGKVAVASVYFPSGSSGPHRQEKKYEFLDCFLGKLEEFKKNGKSVVLCGDWNIAHKQIDIKNWKSNQKNSGFLPEERAWMDRVINDLGYVDAFRALNQNPDEYTWWSQRANARANNVGWRIDYQMVSPCVKKHIKAVSIYRDEYFSDHAPLIIDYELEL